MSLQPTLELPKCLVATTWMSIGHLKFNMYKSEFLISSQNLALPTVLPISE